MANENNFSTLKRVGDYISLDSLDRRQYRSGILPYTFIDDTLYICFGVDRVSGDLTDFSGRQQASEGVLDCAVREFREESRYAFGNVTVEDILNSLCIYNRTSLCILLHVIPEFGKDVRGKTVARFNEKSNLDEEQKISREYNECSEIVWLSETELEELFITNVDYKTVVFRPINELIRNCSHLVRSINTMKSVLKGTVNHKTPEQGFVDLVKSMKISAVQH